MSQHLQTNERSRVPVLLKVTVTLFVAVLVPVYWKAYGFLHFLWISDVALFLTLVALWRESRLLNSMMVLGALPFEMVWVVDFVFQLLTDTELIGLAAYMFEEERSLLLRGLSLFHLPLPVIWLWLLVKWGYDPRALRLQTLLFVAIILATYLLTDPQDNINWVYTPEKHNLEWMPQPLWVALYLPLIPLLVFLPLHRLLVRLDQWA
jgi:hypothetical protein